MDFEIDLDFATLAALAAFVTPFVVALFKNLGKWQWPTWLVKLLAFGVALLMGVIAYAVANDLSTLTVSDVFVNGTIVWGFSQIVYDKLVGGTSAIGGLSAAGDTTSPTG